MNERERERERERKGETKVSRELSSLVLDRDILCLKVAIELAHLSMEEKLLRKVLEEVYLMFITLLNLLRGN